MSLSERLAGLHELHQRGLLTDAEFTLAKAREIGVVKPPPNPAATPAPVRPSPQAATYPTLNPVVPGVGLALGAASVAEGGLFG